MRSYEQRQESDRAIESKQNRKKKRTQKQKKMKGKTYPTKGKLLLYRT